MNEVISHVGEFVAEMNERIPVALEACGLKAEGYAELLVPVASGNLKGSLTHMQEDEKTEIIGTNVEYASYVC